MDGTSLIDALGLGVVDAVPVSTIASVGSANGAEAFEEQLATHTSMKKIDKSRFIVFLDIRRRCVSPTHTAFNVS